MPVRAPDPAAGTLLLAILLLCVAVAAWAEEAPQTLLLEVIINGQATNRIGEFLDHREGGLYARPQELREVGFVTPDGLDDEPIPLSRLPGIHYRVDLAGQILLVTAANESLTPTMLNALSSTPDRALLAQNGTGFTLNDSLVATSAGGRSVLSGMFDGRLFTPYGVASSGFLASKGDGVNEEIRLDSLYTVSDPDALRRFRVGDVVGGGLSWTRPIRLGGVQFAKDFGMRPDLVTFPVPGLSGQVAVPSTVDVLVNGVRQLSRQVQPGPFQVQQLPLVTGAGTVSMVITDALGKQTTENLPFYTSTQLLTPGLSDYSFEAGAVRLNYGAVSDDYTSAAVSVSARHGLTSWLTVEGHAETAPSLAMGGAGGILDIGNFGVISLSAAGSAYQGRSGQQFNGAIERTAPQFSLSASLQLASRDFMDIAAVKGQPVPRSTFRGSASLALDRAGSLSLAYTRSFREAATTPVILSGPFYADALSGVGINSSTGYLLPAQHVQLLTATYNKQLFDDISLYATGYRDFASAHSAGLVIGISIPLGGRSSANISGGKAYQQGYATVQAMRSVVEPGDIGGQLLASVGTPAREFGEVDYKSPWALFGAGADRSLGQTAYRATAQGAISFVDGEFFASNTIYDSFAVVDTEGVAGIDVLQENRRIGSTGSSGRLLVPDLRSYDTNRIAIDARDVPADIDIGQTTREVRPQDRSGVTVKFPIQISHGALLRLVDESGEPIPVGSTATAQATGVTVPVGYDGEAFLQDLAPENQVTVTTPDGWRCVTGFAFQRQPRILPTIGPLLCHSEAFR